MEAIKQQVEYYLSDTNLRHDKFFHDFISSASEGYVPFDVLLKCKKLRNLTTSPDEIKQAIRSSAEVEMNSDQTAVRRVDSRPLPPLTRKKEKQAAVPEPPTIIMKVTAQEETKSTWKELRDAFRGRYLDTDLLYTRFTGKEGHIGIPGRTAKERLQKIETDGLELDGQKVEIKLFQGEELTEFWRAHGSHFDLCNQQGKRKRDNSKPSLTLGGKSFQSVSKVKTYVKTLLNITPDDTPIDPSYFNVLLDILKHHPNFEEKARNLKNFTAGRHPSHKDSRCFFIVREDGTKEDFSVTKCLSQLS